VTCIQYNPLSLALANGSTDRTVKYWDLEKFENISATAQDSSAITHLAFDPDRSPDILFAASGENIKLWNIENNKLLDQLSIIPKQISDLKVAQESRFLMMSAIQNNSVQVWYAPLEQFNYDESIDTVPSSESSGLRQNAPVDTVGRGGQLPSQMVQQPFGGMASSADTEMTDMTRATYVRAPADKPLGIPLNQFE
jgi:katanin p80 WD40 repeat-containing subunit B1